MRLYIVRHYILTSLATSAFMTIGSTMSGLMELDTTLRQALFWGPIVAAVVVHREFAWRGIWPLFDNLRISRYRPLAMLVAISLVINQIALWWIL
jgi:hypothetical protein